MDVRTNDPVADLDVDFDLRDGATNFSVMDARTSTSGIVLVPFDGKKRVRFRIAEFPYNPGKYWVTIGLTSRETGHLYHVQTQRYFLEVADVPRPQQHEDVRRRHRGGRPVNVPPSSAGPTTPTTPRRRGFRCSSG